MVDMEKIILEEKKIDLDGKKIRLIEKCKISNSNFHIFLS